MIPGWLDAALPMAVIGALPGALRAWARTHTEHGHARAAADALIGIVFAAAIADWLTPESYPKLALVIGLTAGMVGAKTLDAFFELIPELVRELAMSWINKSFGRRNDYGWHYPRMPHRRLDNPDGDDDGNQ